MKNTIILKSLIKTNEKEFEKQYKALATWCNRNGYEIKTTEDCFYASYKYIEGSEEEKAFLRKKRTPLLRAFTTWATNVAIGIESKDETVLRWRLSLLDLNKTAFENVPSRIEYYIER